MIQQGCASKYQRVPVKTGKDLTGGGGGHLYFRLDIILVEGLSRHTLNMYFSCMKIDPKYAFLHAFFLIFPLRLFQNLSIWSKTQPFSSFTRFCIPEQCTHIHCLVLKKNNTNYVNFFFYEDDIQHQIQMPPPPGRFDSDSRHLF